MEYREVKIEIYIPIQYITSLRDALHDIGACRVGNYDHCLSVTQVTGSWRPLIGANPYDGVVDEISYGQECKVEIRCPKDCIKAAVDVIKSVHPYEEPLFNIVPLINHLYE